MAHDMKIDLTTSHYLQIGHSTYSDMNLSYLINTHLSGE